MRKLIRLLAGVVLISAFFALHASPAFADHGVGAGPTADPYDDPEPPTTGVHGDASEGWHEEQPDLAISNANDPCVVTGTVKPGVPFASDAHLVNVPLVNDDPSHSHFEFLNTIINCVGAGPLGVDADGGNDGHMIDILDPAAPVGGANGDILELDGAGPDSTAQHDFNKHHGSVNESGWSHSANYSGGTSAGQSNDCPEDTTKDQNKADININQQNPPNNSASGWVKYIRVGVVVYAWGCAPGIDTNDRFSSVLVILPNLFPTGVGPFPGSTFNPLCPLDFLTEPPFNLTAIPASPCGFVLAGVAWRGDAWL